MKTDFIEYRKMLNDALDTVDLKQLDMMKNELLRMAKNGYPLLVCGNGGSAAIAEHMSCDHTKGICMDTELTPFVMSLSSNMALTSAISNDINYHEIFSKQIEWFNSPNASVLVISSSGNSPNILKALIAANKRNMPTMALLGFDGGAAKDLAQIPVHVNYKNYGVVEDCHQIIMHSVAQHIRSSFAIESKALRL